MTGRSGGEEYLHQLVRHLAGVGEQLTLATMSCPHPSAGFPCPTAQEISSYEATCGYAVQKIQNTTYGTGRWITQSALFANIRIAWDLYRLARRTQAQYMVFNQGIFLCTAGWLAAFAARIPVVQVVHHLPSDLGPGLRGILRKWLLRFNHRRVNLNVCVSRATEHEVGDFVKSRCLITAVIPNSIDIDAIQEWGRDASAGKRELKSFRGRRYPADSGPFILTVAWLSRNKGIHLVINAMERILHEYPEARYVVAGDGSYRAELERIAKSVLPASQRGAVTFLGWVSDDEKYALYDACDLYVMPSSEEGFGLVYAEAAAFGKPSVGCDVMGVPEAIAHEETGLLVPPNDADAVADAVLRLLRDDDERSRMGSAARKLVESMGTWEDRAKQFQQLMKELTRKRGKR